MKIPKKERFETYKKALVLCENWVYGTYGLDNEPALCFLLPCIHFNIKDYGDVGKKAWYFEDTPLHFPEIEEFVVSTYDIDTEAERNAARIEFLKTLLTNGK